MRLELRYARRADGSRRGPYFLLRYNVGGRRKSRYVHWLRGSAWDSGRSSIKLVGELAALAGQWLQAVDPEFKEEVERQARPRAIKLKGPRPKPRIRGRKRKMPMPLVALLKTFGYSMDGALINRSRSSYMSYGCAAARFALLPKGLKKSLGSVDALLLVCKKAESAQKSANRTGAKGSTYDKMLADELQKVAGAPPA